MCRTIAGALGVVVSAILAGVALPAVADELIPVERRLPPNVLQFVSVRDVPALSKRIRESLAGRMLADPTVWEHAGAATGTDARRLVEQHLTKELLKPFEEKVGIPLDKFVKMLSGELTFAVVYEPNGEFETVVLVNLGEHAGVVRQHRDHLGRLLIEGEFRFVEETIRETSCTLLEPVKGTSRHQHKFRPGFFCKDSWLVAATSEKLLDAVLLRWDGRHVETLHTEPEFLSIQQKSREGTQQIDLEWFRRKPMYDEQDGFWGTLRKAAAQLPFDMFVVMPLTAFGCTELPSVSFADDDTLGSCGGILAVTSGHFDLFSQIIVRRPDSADPQPRSADNSDGPEIVESTSSVPPPWIRSDVARIGHWQLNLARVFREVPGRANWSDDRSTLLAAADSLCRLIGNEGERGVEALTGSIWLVETATVFEDDKECSNAVLAMGIRDEKKMQMLIADLQKEQKIVRYPKQVAGSDTWEVELLKPRGKVIYKSKSWDEMGAKRKLLGLDALDAEEQRTCFLSIAHQHLFVSESVEALTHVLGAAPDVAPLAGDLGYKSLAERTPRTSLFVQYRRFSPADIRRTSKMAAAMKKDQLPAAPASNAAADAEVILRYFPPIAGFAEANGNDVRMTVFRLRNRQ